MLPPAVEEKLKETEERLEEVQQLLADPEVLSSPPRLRLLSRECGSLAKVADEYKRYRELSQTIADNQELCDNPQEDSELQELALEENEKLRPELEQAEQGLLDRILVQDKNANRNVIMEIRAGTGGDEAALFAGDLFRMYGRLAERQGWKVEVLDGRATDLGGFKEIIFSVAGEEVHLHLRYEMGGHRVQRVPQTETSGRIHTSAATVAVMGEPEEVEIEVKEADLRVDFFRASGPGGQKVNRTSSAVRLTHLPTGLVVSIQDETSQHKNRAKAMRVLRSRIYDHVESQRQEKEQSLRRGQIGSGDRSQRIRTYNFPQNRVTDHRIKENFNLEKVVKEGALEKMLEMLRSQDREQRLQEL